MKNILFVCFCISLIACTSSTEPTESNDVIDSIKQDTIVVEEDTIHRMKLSFIGDIMGHGNQIRSAAGSRENMKSKDMNDFNYETCFRYVQPIFEEADLMIGNLELTLSNKGKYSGYPMFRSPDVLASYLKEAGFDILTTCNNHSNDGFSYGINHTIDVLDSVGIIHTGTFKNQEERDSLYPLIVEKEVDGTTFRLAFLNYTYSTNGIPTPEPAVVNMIEQDQMYKDIVKAKESNPDMIIAMMHWGNEYWLDESDRQKRRAKFLWENGVDVVIGAHPHVVEPIKTDTLWNEDSTSSREVLVTYSLGNFISNQYRPNTDIGLIFELELVKNSKTNKTIIGEHDYILVWRYIYGRYDKTLSEGYDWKYTTIPLSAFEDDPKTHLFMSDKQVKAMKDVAARTRKHLAKWQSKERKISLDELGTIVPMKTVEGLTNADSLTEKEERK